MYMYICIYVVTHGYIRVYTGYVGLGFRVSRN